MDENEYLQWYRTISLFWALVLGASGLLCLVGCRVFRRLSLRYSDRDRSESCTMAAFGCASLGILILIIAAQQMIDYWKSYAAPSVVIFEKLKENR